MKFITAYEESKDAVYGYLVYMTRDKQLAEDLSQETFLKMFLHMGKFRQESSAKTWALTIARNVFLTYAKKKRPILIEEENLERSFDYYQNDPEESMLYAEKRKSIEECLMALKEQERTLILLRDYEEMSYEEIGQVLGIEIGQVKSKLHRARKKFRQSYQEREQEE